MFKIALPVEFIGDPPEQFQADSDILLPPDNMQVGGYVRFERIDNGRIQMHSVKPETRWAQEQPLYQVERAEDTGGYRLRQMPPGGVHAISIHALRRIRGHGLTVQPSEAFGLLIGWPERREVLAALPVGRTHVYQERSDLFEGIEHALEPARALAARRGLSVMGLYCASSDWRGFWDISFRVPSCLADDNLMIVPCYGGDWSRDIISLPSPPHGRLPCPWRFSHRRIDSAGINPRRIHSEWIKLFGPMDYGRCEAPAPAATGSGDTCSSPVRDWFSAERLPVDAADIPPVWNSLPEAIEAASQVRIRYAGGSLPGGERLIRPLALFRVEGYDATYLQAIDTDLEEERVFRLDRMEPVDVLRSGNVTG
jgi:hypothetical protein